MNQLRIWDNSVIQKEYRQNYFSVNPNGKKRNMKNDQEFLVQKPKPSYHSKPVSKETVLKLILGQYLHSLPLRSDTFLFNHPSPASVTWLREIFTFFFFCKLDLSVLFSVLDVKSDFCNYPKIKQYLTPPRPI